MRVLVTGGASGLGAALAAAFLARGDEVVIGDINQPVGLESVADAPASTGIGGRASGASDQSRPHAETELGGRAASGASDQSRPHAETELGGRAASGASDQSRPQAEPELGGRAASGASDQSRPHLLRLDVRSDDDWAAAREWVEREWGGLDILVNNAGVAGGGRIDVAGMDEWQWITEINLFGVVRGTRTFVPMFKRQRSGHVVNIASLAGLVHPAGMGSYNAVKAAVVAFSETTSHELAEYDVRCSVVCPSYFRTGLVDAMQGADTAVGQVIGGLVASAPLGPEEIAAAVLAGMDRDEELIIPDDAARAAYDLKLKDRASYDEVMRRQARRLNAMSEDQG